MNASQSQREIAGRATYNIHDGAGVRNSRALSVRKEKAPQSLYENMCIQSAQRSSIHYVTSAVPRSNARVNITQQES